MILVELARYLIAQGLSATFLATPAPSCTPTGSPGLTAYSYKVVANNQLGSTPGGSCSTNTGNATLTVSNYNAIAWALVPGASSYTIYRVSGGATHGVIGTTADGSTTAFNDTGLVGDNTTAPVSNTAATDIGLAATPDAPNKCFVITPYSGRPSVGQFGKADMWQEYPRLQILTRGEPDQSVETWTRANNAYLALGKISVLTLSGVFYENVQCLMPPAPIDSDKQRRPQWVFNIEAARTPSV